MEIERLGMEDILDIRDAWRITDHIVFFLKNGPFPASFSLISSFQYSWQ